MSLQVQPVAGLPEISHGSDLATLIVEALDRQGTTLVDGDILVVTSKVISKAAGLRVPAGGRAAAVLEQSVRVVAERQSATGITRIVQSRAGPVLAGAGIDASNVGPPQSPDGGDPPQATVLLLPPDPDAAAARLLADLEDALDRRSGRAPRLGLVISDTAGRPWRRGQVDFALGAAGLRVAVDYRDRRDDDGLALAVTMRAVADEVACAADLVKSKTRRIPVAVVHGLADLVVASPTGAGTLVRTDETDWFALGHREAVRGALGVTPGTQGALEVGIAPVDPAVDTREARIARACALAVHPAGLSELAPTHPRAHLVTHEVDLGGAAVHVIQYGVRVEAPDSFTLGVVVARLMTALAGEDVPVALAQQEDRPTPGGTPRARALLVFC